MTTGLSQGEFNIDRMCWLAGVSRASYYRHWLLDTHLRATLAIEALEMAITDRQPVPGSLVHHSDRGVQYACGAYSELLHLHGIQASMSRVGNPYVSV
ncbi:DDE-type integrase/transposase/recombinase [Sinorhizobium sp. BJ1]|uniref:DDE-type integrase/transposase/recombinase n=1 Tax=Sinorhizobium sp. BJ1 TaxID=2035455 RepID=UPI0011854333|nr:DDE-type integrase/transposase/recombinase [Sinorhizobium sp. BJ1]